MIAKNAFLEYGPEAIATRMRRMRKSKFLLERAQLCMTGVAIVAATLGGLFTALLGE